MIVKSCSWLVLCLISIFTLSACSGSTAPDPKSNDTPAPDKKTEMSEAISPNPTPAFLPAEDSPRGADREFRTDFSKHTVSYEEILSGGPPKDGIPAIDQPQFVSVEQANAWLKPVEPVVLIRVGSDVRAYPIQILIWHEIVNDTIGELPLVVTFCPLCNTAIAFKRTVNDQVLDFGTTGRLRYSNLIMYDRQTETWWQQATGDAIAGELAGIQLPLYPAEMVSWETLKTTFPNAKVLSRDTGFSRSYGSNPYIGYDDVNQPPFLYDGPLTPGQLPAVARVLTLDLNGEAVAYPYQVLQDVHLINDQVGGMEIVVFWQAGTASALDAGTIASGRDVGSAVVYKRRLEDRALTFSLRDGRFIDDQTGSEWNVLGVAVRGQLAGQRLEALAAINHFWFSWAAFRPETRVYQP